MTNKGRKNIFVLIILILISAVFSYFISYLIINFISNDFTIIISPESFYDEYAILLSLLLFAICVFIIFFVFFKYVFTGYNKMISKATTLDSNIYGSSEWQTEKEINKNYKKIEWNNINETDDAQGFLISSKIKKDGTVTVNRVQEAHSLILATTRVGKTKYFLSPNIQYLANCPNKPSMFLTDPKGELFADNSDLLAKRGYNIFVFNLDEPTKSHKYNPLGIVWDFYHLWKSTGDSSYLDEAEALLREVALTISPFSGNGDPTWDVGAQNIIQGICLAMLEDSTDKRFNMTKEKFTIWQILNLLTQGDVLLKDFVLRRDKTSLAKRRLMQFVDNKAGETIGSFAISTTNKLNQFVDTGMTYLMSDTELALDDISKKPYAIFCITPDNNKTRHPLAVLFASQIYKYLIYLAKKEAHNNKEAQAQLVEAQNNKETKIQLEEIMQKYEEAQKLPNEFFMIFEEFGNFPKMDCIEQILSIGGSRRIWACLVLQSLSQLNKIYGKEAATTLLNNMQLQIYMGTTENETNKYYSEFMGSKTVKKNSLQLASADLTKDITGSTSAEKAMLILPDELTRLKKGEVVLKVFRHQPVRTYLLPIFDKDLQKNKTFNIGSHRFDWKRTTLDNDKLFYDLIERDNNFDGISTHAEMEDIDKIAADIEEPVKIDENIEYINTDDSVLAFLQKIAKGNK